MILHYHVATAIQDWTKNPHNDKIWIFNSIYKGWEEVPQENIGKLFLIATEEDYSFICIGEKPVKLNYANGIYFMPGISIEKLKTMIEMGEKEYLYYPSLIEDDCYGVLNTMETDIDIIEYICRNGFLYKDQKDAAEAGYILFDKNHKVK